MKHEQCLFIRDVILYVIKDMLVSKCIIQKINQNILIYCEV